MNHRKEFLELIWQDRGWLCEFSVQKKKMNLSEILIRWPSPLEEKEYQRSQFGVLRWDLTSWLEAFLTTEKRTADAKSKKKRRERWDRFIIYTPRELANLWQVGHSKREGGFPLTQTELWQRTTEDMRFVCVVIWARAIIFSSYKRAVRVRGIKYVHTFIEAYKSLLGYKAKIYLRLLFIYIMKMRVQENKSMRWGEGKKICSGREKLRFCKYYNAIGIRV